MSGALPADDDSGGGSPLSVTHQIPASTLGAYIARLSHWEGAAPYARMALLPVPTLHLIVNFGDACAVYTLHAGETDDAGPYATCGASCAAGLWKTAHVVAWPRDLDLLTVSFRPGGAYPFLRLPLGELRDQVAPLEALWGRGDAEELRERLY